MRFARGPRAIDATVNFPVLLDPVSNDTAIAVRAMRRQRVNRAFETVERVMLALHHHLERFVIFVFANFACRHITNVSHFGVLVAVSESTYSFGVMCRVEKLNAAYEPSTELMDNLMKVSANDSVSETVKTILFQLAERQLR